MNFCPYCGTKILEGASFCTGCGAPVKAKEQSANTTTAEPAQNAQNTQSAPTYTPTYTYSYAQPQAPVSKENSILSMIFGILSTFFSIFSMIPFTCFVFIALSIVFIVLAKVKRNAHVRVAGEDNGFSRAGKITSIVAIPLVSFFGFIGFFLTIGAMA